MKLPQKLSPSGCPTFGGRLVHSFACCVPASLPSEPVGVRNQASGGGASQQKVRPEKGRQFNKIAVRGVNFSPSGHLDSLHTIRSLPVTVALSFTEASISRATIAQF
ncbi:hypothetical protein TNIN_53541 [Trichonephila inaurata madagascariensis]|uniref:Uncharacterized protein n=1 Tax=Trichonephila inaurata madagascariensis TaxID=2747483 RepID=A0A8X7CRH0_9ARAC|nr:hypothetical protein TNIN_53541 [Trichonephila inaurata madagascariensis]